MRTRFRLQSGWPVSLITTRNVLRLFFFVSIMGSAINPFSNSLGISAVVTKDRTTPKIKDTAALFALVTRNNDFSTDEYPTGTSVPAPEIVAKKIALIANNELNKWKHLCQGLPVPCPYSDVRFYIGPIFRVVNSKVRYHIYIFRSTGPFSSIFYHFIAFDPQAMRVTQAPPVVYGKWMQGNDADSSLLKPPLLNFRDMENDGKIRLVVKESAHNGTMYNAVLEHFFEVKPDMSMVQRLVVESHTVDLYTEDRNGVITRKITSIAPGELKMDVSLILDDDSRTERKLGEVFLASRNGAPYKVLSRNVLDEKYEHLLISASGEGDDAFLQNGYSFRY